MSKRSERRERQKERARREIRGALAAALAGLVLLALGAVGLLRGVREFHAYQNAGEVLTVPAQITYAEIRTEKDADGYARDVYDVRLEYTADARTYQGRTRLYAPVRQGDTREIEVYRTAGGDYRIPTIRTRGELFAACLTPGIGLAVGALLALSGIVVALSARRRLRREK